MVQDQAEGVERKHSKGKKFCQVFTLHLDLTAQYHDGVMNMAPYCEPNQRRFTLLIRLQESPCTPLSTETIEALFPLPSSAR